MKRSIAFVYVLGLFLLGILIGALGMHLYGARHPLPGHPRDGSPRGLPLTRFDELLDLTPEQQARIEEIRRESHADAEALHEEMLPKVRAHMEQTRQRIAEVLTPEQRQKFDELADEHRARFEHFVLEGPRRRPPHGGMGRRKPAPPPSD